MPFRLLLFLTLVLAPLGRAEIRINELMASNVRTFPNASDFEDYPDWIELVNPASEPRSLEGYYLSDDPADPRKWRFADEAVIGAGEHLVVVADGHDRPRGFTGKRDYYPRLNFTTLYHHTNFKLSSEGEDLLLSRERTGVTSVIPTGASWKYDDSRTPPEDGWKAPVFDDSTWASGPAPFGYDAPTGWPIATTTNAGDDPDDKHPTTYFRRTFSFPDNAEVWSTALSYEVADGAVLFLNGVEIARHNLPPGPITKETRALMEISPLEAPVTRSPPLPHELIRPGENVLALEVHRARPEGLHHFFDCDFEIIGFNPGTFQFSYRGTDFQGRDWTFLDDNTTPPEGWTSPGFDASAWSSGPSPLGYSEPSEISNPDLTPISYGDDPTDKILTTHFRRQFHVDDPESVREMVLTFQIDDGAYFYLNGDEIHRENVEPTNPVNRVDGEPVPVEVRLPATSLVAGTNTLAVAVVQDSPTSPSMRFQASLDLTTPLPLEVIDRVTFATQVDDVSLGRDAVDPETWSFQADPSPGAGNGGPVVTTIRETSPETVLSPAGGLYQEAQTVTLSAPAGEIRYTTDGTHPTSSSSLYTEPLEITAATVLRARAYAPGKVPGPIATATYLVGEEFTPGIPVLSVTAPPDTLFDPEIGIYGHPNRGGGNVRKGIDAPGHLEFFPADGRPGFSVTGGFRLGGENNFMSHGQKALNFATRGRYGDDALNHDLFPGSGIGRFTALTLREGGDDWGKAHLTDALFDPIARGRLSVETNRYRPASLFINGQYWGLYNLRDRWDENWFFQEYGTNDGEYDHIKVGEPEAENGTRDDWDELLTFLQDNPAGSPENWEIITSRLDLDSLIDFAICESWGRNSSWRGNREWWRDHRPGSKWRWFIPDMDRTFANTSTSPVLRSMLTQETTLRHVRTAPRFQARFAQRAAAHLAETLSAERVRSLIETLSGVVRPEMTTRQFERWNRPTPDGYEDSLQRMLDFASARDQDYLLEVQTELQQAAPVELTLATEGEGSFRFAGIPLSPQTFAAFPGVATELEALPAPGYRFDRWTGAEGGALTSVTLDGPATLTAHFLPDSSTEISGELTADTTLTPDQSPYVVTSDLIVPAGLTLTIEAGVTLEFAEAVDLRVMGRLLIKGSAEAKVRFQGRHGATWGGVSLEQPDQESVLSHLVLRGASRGHDPVRYPSAISGLDAEVVMDFIEIGESRGPLFFRGGRMVLRDSHLDIPLTGDGVNVKGGQATTIRCTFTGNGSPDTDGIDYDGVVDGLIRDCRIYDFRGFNSDGIDVGEQCRNCLVEGNTIYYSSDKGISVGQGSTLILRRNLIVGCPLGIAVKDEGSSVIVDQNTLVDCGEGVALYEKNFGVGGGQATISNTLFSGCEKPVTADQFSSYTIRYSLSDTVPLDGPTNLLGDPRFVDPGSSNYELAPDSPAIDAGDPDHESDPDGSRADIGALYQYERDDYPYDLTPTVVVNEVLANSGDGADWLELRNRTTETIDLGGWFLSDDRTNLKKFRIADGTTIAPGAFLLFTEDLHFGEASNDPGKREAFALSDTGETVFLSSAVGEQLTYYRFEEDFGPSLEGQTIGSHYKVSSDDYDFVPLASPTPGSRNSSPKVGPVVISEIMYHAEVEFLELVNISPQAVTLAEAGVGWLIDRGIFYQFPGSDPVSLAPGERLILTEDRALFQATYQPDPDLQVLAWTSGKLDNSGETVQLDRPGPLTTLGSQSHVRVDRVKYDEAPPWDVAADGQGRSLTRIRESAYGNDFINWEAALPSPGLRDLFASYEDWAAAHLVGGPEDDDDGDGLSNQFEYAFARDPQSTNDAGLLEVVPLAGSGVKIRFPLEAGRPDVVITLEGSDDLQSWNPVPTTLANGFRESSPAGSTLRFYRLRLLEFE